jgi:hypothetical protein
MSIRITGALVLSFFVSSAAWASCPDMSGHYVSENESGNLTSEMYIGQSGCDEVRLLFANGTVEMIWLTDGQSRPVNPEWSETSYWNGSMLVNEVAMKNGFRRTAFERINDQRLMRVIDLSVSGSPARRFESVYRKQ